MVEPVLSGKRILAVDDEPDVLTVLEAEILEACPDCTMDRATTYEGAKDLLESRDYDIVILDIMGVRGFELLAIAVAHDFRVAMLTAHALSAEALKISHDMGARAYLPKDKLGELVPFLEDILRYQYEPGWKRLIYKLEKHFHDRFESDWRRKAGIDSW
jgi:DNA-binding response OmpR family regulator